MATTDRRAFLRRAGIAGVAAWTAPLLIESLASPAAAASLGGSIFTGEVLTQTSNAAGTNLATTSRFSANLNSSTVLLMLVAAAWPNDGSTARALSLTGPFSSATAIGTNAATNAPWVQFGSSSPYSHHLYAYYAVCSNSKTGVTASFTTAPDFAALIAIPMTGLTTGGPVSKFARASDTTSPYGNPTYNLASAATSGAAKLCVGATTNTSGSTTLAAPSGFDQVAQVSATSGSSHGSLDLAVFFGASATNTSAGSSPGTPWGTIACELA